jgi:hypothetical protein
MPTPGGDRSAVLSIPAVSFIPHSSVWMRSRLLDAGVLFGIGRVELQLAVDRQRIEEHGLGAVLIETRHRRRN